MFPLSEIKYDTVDTNMYCIQVAIHIERVGTSRRNADKFVYFIYCHYLTCQLAVSYTHLDVYKRQMQNLILITSEVL